MNTQIISPGGQVLSPRLSEKLRIARLASTDRAILPQDLQIKNIKDAVRRFVKHTDVHQRCDNSHNHPGEACRCSHCILEGMQREPLLPASLNPELDPWLAGDPHEAPCRDSRHSS
jgi:hypothetical protein